MSRQLADLQKALQEDFLQRYSDVVTRKCFQYYVSEQPASPSLSDRQLLLMSNFTRRFAEAFNIVADAMLGAPDTLADIIAFRK